MKRVIPATLTAGLLTAMLPIVTAGAPPVRDCPPNGWAPMSVRYLDNFDATVGNPDRDGDFYCVKVSKGLSKHSADRAAGSYLTIAVVRRELRDFER